MKLNINIRHLKTILISTAVLLTAVLIFINIGPSQNNLNNDLTNNSLEISATPSINQQQTTTASIIPPDTSTPGPNQSHQLPQISREDITLSIESISTQEDKLLLSYKIQGLPANMFSPERMDALTNTLDDEPQPDQIRLPDNTILPISNGSNCQGAGDLSASWLTCYLTFPPLPENTTTFTLEIDRLNNALPAEFPENWEIPITFSNHNESTSMDTVIQEPDQCSQEIENVNLCLLKTSQTSQESNFNFGIYIQLDENNAYLQEMSPITLTNAKGQYHILTGGKENPKSIFENSQFTSLFSLVTGPITDSETRTFHLNWITLNISDSKPIHFSPQSNASIGQEWNIDQTIQFAGYSIDILKARLKTKTETDMTYEFEIKMSNELSGVSVSSNASSMSYSSAFDADRNMLLGRLTIPTDTDEETQFDVSNVIVNINGPWEIAWQPSKTEFSEPSQTKVIPTRMAPEIDPLQSGNPLLIELSDYINQAYSTYNQPGWIVQKMERESPETDTLLGSKDQTTTPPHIKIQTYMHLDENGFIDTRITSIKTIDDQIFSINIDKENVHFTLPDGLGGISPDIYMEKPTLDLHALSQINGYLRENGQLTKTPTQLNTIDCLLYEATRPYNPPIDFSNHPKPVIQMSLLIWINPDTGEILQKQNTITYEDGASKITNTEYNISVETIDSLPAEVQSILDSIVIP